MLCWYADGSLWLRMHTTLRLDHHCANEAHASVQTCYIYIYLSIRYGGDGLGGDNDSDRGTPEAAARLPKSPWTSSKILRAFLARTCASSSERLVRAVLTWGGASCQGYWKEAMLDHCQSTIHINSQGAKVHRLHLLDTSSDKRVLFTHQIFQRFIPCKRGSGVN